MSDQPVLTSESTIIRSPDQVSGQIDDRVVLLSIENGEYYNMNEVGSRIWELLEKPMTVAELTGLLTDEFEITTATCQQETLGFLKRLNQDGLLKIKG